MLQAPTHPRFLLSSSSTTSLQDLDLVYIWLPVAERQTAEYARDEVL